MECSMCPRNCCVDRSKSAGFCGEGESIRVAKTIENFMWEEPCISGKKGALAIFFSGCNLKCAFCQNYEISHIGKGQSYTTEEFKKMLEGYDLSKFSCIDLVSPSQFAYQIYESLKNFKSPIPIVYNTNAYEKVEAITKIAEVVDVFLPDFKFYDRNLCKITGAEDYFDVASKDILKMTELKKNIFKQGQMCQGVLIRHLILPNCVKDSFDVLNFISANVSDPYISIMGQFTPTGRGFNRKITQIELKAVLAHAKRLGLTKGYFQDLESANDCFIPKF